MCNKAKMFRITRAIATRKLRILGLNFFQKAAKSVGAAPLEPKDTIALTRPRRATKAPERYAEMTFVKGSCNGYMVAAAAALGRRCRIDPYDRQYNGHY